LSATIPAFSRWWNSSKYCQVIYANLSDRQVAFDGWNAAIAHRQSASPVRRSGILPFQSENVGCAVVVNFDNIPNSFIGILLRDDIECPFTTIIKLESGDCILGSECQYSIHK